MSPCGLRIRPDRTLCRLGARRIAACDPDRDHAPRGVRARSVAAESRLSNGRGHEQAFRTNRGSGHRRRRGTFRRRRAKDGRSQGRDNRDAAFRRRSPAPCLSRADTRPHRLPGRAFDRYPRQRGHEPTVSRLRPLERRDRGATQRRFDFQRQRRIGRVCNVSATVRICSRVSVRRSSRPSCMTINSYRSGCRAGGPRG